MNSLLRLLIRPQIKLIIPIISAFSLILPLAAYSYKLTLEKQNLEKNETLERTYYEVTQIIDGDSFKIKINKKEVEVRLLGINTTEITPQIECYSLEAKKYLTDHLQNQKVFLLEDQNNTDKDIYGRLLRYAYLPDNQQINALLLKNGYAYYYPYFDLAYSKYFRKLENDAKQKKKGIWGECHSV